MICFRGFVSPAIFPGKQQTKHAQAAIIWEALDEVLLPASMDVVTADAVSSGRGAKLEIDVAGGIVIRLREDASTEILERVLTVVCHHGAARGSRGKRGAY